MCWPRMVRTTGDELVSSEVTVEIFEWSIGAMCCCSILLINHTIRDGLPQIFTRGQRRHFAYHFQVADDTMQTNVHKMLYLFYTTMKMSHVTPTVTKIRFLAALARYITIIYTIANLPIFQTGCFSKHWQLSPDWTWTIHKYGCGTLIQLTAGWTSLFNLLSEMFSTLRLSEMF